jgi:hypothetical protein
MKTDFESMQEQRTYIRNLVDRKLKFIPKCSVCGSKDVTIIHNFKHPYDIGFICKSCRAGKTKEELQKIPKINLLENIEVNSRYSHSKNLVLTKEIKNLINESLKTNLSLTEFLREKKFSYKKFNYALELYEKERKNITQDVKTHFKSLRAEKIKNSIKNHKS